MGLFDWVGDVVNAVGSFLSDPFGFRNIGKGIPQSFSIAHNINLDGKIDASVNVSGTVKVEATLRMPELVQAARLVRDGLVKFDLTGGALQQVVNAFSESNEHRKMLSELADNVESGSNERTDSEYLLWVSFVNDSTRIVSGSSDATTLFRVETSCRCLVTVDFNLNNLLANSLIGIGSTPPGVTLEIPPRKDFEIRLNNVLQENQIRVSLKRFGDPEELKPCRLQVRLVEKTANWSYTVFEAILDGESGETDITARVYVGDARSNAKPKFGTTKTSELVRKLNKLIEVLGQPPVGTGISNVAELARALIDVSSTRAMVTQEVSDLVAEFGKASSGAFDVRTPFYLVVMNTGPHKLVASAAVTNATANDTVVYDSIVLGVSDEVAVKIPLQADFNVATAPVQRNVRINVRSQSGTEPTFYNVAIRAGHPWDSKTIFARSYFIGNQSFDVPITLWDFLA